MSLMTKRLPNEVEKKEEVQKEPFIPFEVLMREIILKWVDFSGTVMELFRICKYISTTYRYPIIRKFIDLVPGYKFFITKEECDKIIESAKKNEPTENREFLDTLFQLYQYYMEKEWWRENFIIERYQLIKNYNDGINFYNSDIFYLDKKTRTVQPLHLCDGISLVDMTTSHDTLRHQFESLIRGVYPEPILVDLMISGIHTKGPEKLRLQFYNLKKKLNRLSFISGPDISEYSSPYNITFEGIHIFEIPEKCDNLYRFKKNNTPAETDLGRALAHHFREDELINTLREKLQLVRKDLFDVSSFNYSGGYTTLNTSYSGKHWVD